MRMIKTYPFRNSTKDYIYIYVYERGSLQLKNWTMFVATNVFGDEGVIGGGGGGGRF
jgi:hypothetical protein